MRRYVDIDDWACVARARAYHRTGRLWAKCTAAEVRPMGAMESEEFIAACGLLAEACSYLVDIAEGNMAELNLSMFPEHLDAAFRYAWIGLHYPARSAVLGIAYLESDRERASLLCGAVLRDFERLTAVAELDLRIGWVDHAWAGSVLAMATDSTSMAPKAVRCHSLD